MILVDTSVWIDVLRDKTGNVVRAFKSRISNEVIVFSRFVHFELLQGANAGQSLTVLDLAEYVDV